jgi:hypothetical protein
MKLRMRGHSAAFAASSALAEPPKSRIVAVGR